MYEIIVPTSVQKRILRYGQFVEEQSGFEEKGDDVVDRIFNVIYSLSENPDRDSHRRVGKYANTEYRQIFAGKYIIVYKVHKARHRVHIDTVRHMLEDF